MVRKPSPKDAAARVREFLATEGLQLTQRKALEVVALVEGFNTWQAMAAQQREDAPKTKTKAKELTAYELFWQSLRVLIHHKVSGLCFVVRGNCAADYRVIDPEEYHEDDSHVSFWLEPKTGGAAALFFQTALIENDEEPGAFALRLAVENEDGERLLTWTSGPNYTPQLYTRDVEELRDRLRDTFEPGDILLSLYETPAAKYLKKRF